MRYRPSQATLRARRQRMAEAEQKARRIMSEVARKEREARR